MVTTTSIAAGAERLDSSAEFFTRFRPYWKSVGSKVRKLETRQTYREPGNRSWEVLLQEGLSEALELLPEARAVDVPLYTSLQERGVRFVRVRPVELPMSLYLQWELGCYDFNSSYGEEIRVLDSNDFAVRFGEQVHHDFMVFDDLIAFIHDYDDEGEIRGGWMVSSPPGIRELSNVYDLILGASIPYRDYLHKHKIRTST